LLFPYGLFLVVWGPAQVFLFKSDDYQGTDPAGIIITRLSEMFCRTHTYCLKGDVEGALSFLTKLERGHFHTHGTCQGSPNQNGKIVRRMMSVFIRATE